MAKKILVSGGCGYIGSHTAVDLIEKGFEVISVDNLSRGNIKTLEGIKKITGTEVDNYLVDLCDIEATRQIFKENTDIEGIIHFAAYKTVPESVKYPLKYFKNNLNSLLNLLECAQEFQVENFVFSSSCSVYGNVTKLPVDESTPLGEAECAYARTKQMGEQILADFGKANPNIKQIALRYFNPVGAHESALLGEYAEQPENLVPVITQTAIGRRESMQVHGTDYNTHDGSCIRDYIHVMDIANAHTKALEYLQSGKNKAQFEIFNLGTGNGVSVLEAITAFEKVSGQKLNYTTGPRRAGDVEAIYADNKKAAELLNWKAKRGIEEMMDSAWRWEQNLKKQ
ncbi:MAG: UDP-glucose 4-epimerase GalE [Chitinophagales bacterium]